MNSILLDINHVKYTKPVFMLCFVLKFKLIDKASLHGREGNAQGVVIVISIMHNIFSVTNSVTEVYISESLFAAIYVF